MSNVRDQELWFFVATEAAPGGIGITINILLCFLLCVALHQVVVYSTVGFLSWLDSL